MTCSWSSRSSPWCSSTPRGGGRWSSPTTCVGQSMPSRGRTSRSETVSARGLAAIDTILDRGVDADDVLRGVVEALAAEPGVLWAGIAFVEDGSLVLGPAAGVPDEERRTRFQNVYEG